MNTQKSQPLDLHQEERVSGSNQLSHHYRGGIRKTCCIYNSPKEIKDGSGTNTNAKSDGKAEEGTCDDGNHHYQPLEKLESLCRLPNGLGCQFDA